ncbi:similar to Saccharomyces cerevisiae YPR193C HPA2 Tetrameric histone acetyltransferase with similarity to Gcn5p, Hat1p, Elp3p, and Hpa3p [Maudiozyma saulgeensis]|uniref:Similar to Saccharomyces cerevisiae YPR193C HPA2 Tetrameric histone acetyltransferase with similarity to Gcn5p, Hat1p, Elp3p, and Hpa3p n=1 Tax=Maudiozyma saulgeensis TaxID=1789683 RepID=A0A1X7QXN5_9SACH|nr:similar to Saccharomyces cerevisiae YPR193C HPA2 Tetrameric histone acetyltransferase with similarity to Gcn5p, Hat1p, Elp3p, and Hpa3p [Kazachstania saulgeensis]
MSELKSNVFVRYVQAEDREDWVRLWRKFIATYENPKLADGIEKVNFDRFIDPSVKMWSALAILKDETTGTEKAIGFTDFFTHPSTWQTEDKTYLNDLFVDDEFRVGGVGRKLIEFVYSEADKMGTPAVYWNTDHFNHRAQLLYTKVAYLSHKRIYKREGY